MITCNAVLMLLLAFRCSLGGMPLIQFFDHRHSPRRFSLSEERQRNSLALISFSELRTHDTSIASRGEKCRVAVLDFYDAGAVGGHEWISRELADSLVKKLDMIPSLEFIARDAIRPFERRLKRGRGGRLSRTQVASVAQNAGVDVVIVGRYRCVGEELRIEVQTMRPSRDALSRVLHIRGPVNRIWETEANAAVRVADILGVNLSDAEKERLNDCPTSSPVAFERYCRARQAPEGSHRKIHHLQKALAEDPGFAEAHCLLGNAYAAIGATYRYVEWFNKALDEYRKAVTCDPELAEAYCGMGLVYMMNGRYDLTRRALVRAVKLKPTLMLAQSYLRRLESMGY